MVHLIWLWWFLAVVIMFISARWANIGKITTFHLAWAFTLLAVAWPVLIHP